MKQVSKDSTFNLKAIACLDTTSKQISVLQNFSWGKGLTTFILVLCVCMCDL